MLTATADPVVVVPSSRTGRLRAAARLGGLVAGVAFLALGSNYLTIRGDLRPTPGPFHGDQLYNPYTDADGHWRKANFHIHTGQPPFLKRAHAGEVLSAYRQMGFDIVGISDYGGVGESAPGLIPTYEHGVNLVKRHQVIIGPRRVDGDWFPIWEGLRQKQATLDRLRDDGGFVALAHPAVRWAYRPEDLSVLTSYDALEIAGPWYRSRRALVDGYWDAALSSGHTIWGVAGDDRHDIVREREQLGSFWMMIASVPTDAASVVTALRRGAFYSVAGNDGIEQAHVTALATGGDQVHVAFDRPMEQIRFIGQGGALRATRTGARASYRFRPDDSYIRIEAFVGSYRMYFNPILRVDAPAREVRARLDRGEHS